MRVKNDILRRVAGTELDRLFPGTAPRPRDDLITSVVRQWLTCAGHAGIFTIVMTHWLHLENLPDDQFAVTAYVASSTELCETLLTRGAQMAHVPVILRNLSLRQSALFTTDDGTLLRIRVSPHLRRLEIEDADVNE